MSIDHAAPATAEAGPPPARPATSPLSRPRLLPGIPVLRRGDGEIQIGTDPHHAVVLSGLSTHLAHSLATLDGGMTRAELLEDTDFAEREALLAVLCDLARARLVEDSSGDRSVRTTDIPHERDALPRPEPLATRLSADATRWALRTGRPSATMRTSRARASVVIHGAGRIAVALGRLLAAAGVGRVRVAAGGVVIPEDLGSGYLDADVGTSRETAAARSIEVCGHSVRTNRLPAGVKPDLAVLTDCTVPDPQLVTRLLDSGTVHLLAPVREGNGMVGPLVFPRSTSCLRCLDLHRTDRDPQWPTVAAQLADRPAHADLPTAMTVAAYAAGQSLRVLDDGYACSQPGHGQEQAVCNGTIELNPFDGDLRRRRWDPHPACDCGAAL